MPLYWTLSFLTCFFYLDYLPIYKHAKKRKKNESRSLFGYCFVLSAVKSLFPVRYCKPVILFSLQSPLGRPQYHHRTLKHNDLSMADYAPLHLALERDPANKPRGKHGRVKSRGRDARECSPPRDRAAIFISRLVKRNGLKKNNKNGT